MPRQAQWVGPASPLGARHDAAPTTLLRSAGTYCSDCACLDCANTVAHRDIVMAERKKILERTPHAFAPKVRAAAIHSAPRLRLAAPCLL